MKKTVTVFALSLVLSTASFAQYTANDQLSAAESSAQSHASDAVLVALEAPAVSTTGTAPYWIYFFYSASQHAGYIVYTIAGNTFVYNDTVNDYNKPVGSNWVNSNVAIAAADANGGNTFRNANSNTTVFMLLIQGNYSQDTSKIVWYVQYSSGSSNLIIFIDAVTGNYLGTLSSVPAPQQVSLFRLNQNYPNPFASATSISFTLGAPQRVTLAVYNQLGTRVATLARGRMDAGAHSVSFNTGGLPAGVYFYKLAAGGSVETKPMIIAR